MKGKTKERGIRKLPLHTSCRQFHYNTALCPSRLHLQPSRISLGLKALPLSCSSMIIGLVAPSKRMRLSIYIILDLNTNHISYFSVIRCHKQMHAHQTSGCIFFFLKKRINVVVFPVIFSFLFIPSSYPSLFCFQQNRIFR